MTRSRPEGLPDFERPPLDETILSIQFARLPVKNIHVGLLWQKFGDRYPQVEEQSPLPAVFETFGVRRIHESQELNITLGDSTVRYWFISADQRQLLQIQPDRLIHNWRQQQPEGEYPRYEVLRERFQTEVDEVAAFFLAHSLGVIQCNQCEVTYVNAISGVDGRDPNEDLETIFTFWSERYSDDYITHIERGRFTFTFLMGSSDAPKGRIHVSLLPAVRTVDSTPAVRLSITARGRPEEESIESSFRWMDEGRAAVVKTFASITTKKMHTIWGRKDI